MDYAKIISAAARDMRPSGIRKFFDIAAEMKDCISLGVGEPDFKTPWTVRDAGIRSLEKGRTWYTSNSGLAELREETCNYLSRRMGLSYTPGETVVTVGGSEAIDMCIRALVNPGDEVIIPEPCFVCYYPITTLTGGVPVSVPLRAEDKFKLTAEALKAAITPRTKAIIPVDIGGAICDYDRIFEIVRRKQPLFTPSDNAIQRSLGRVAVVADAAHAFGASRHGKMCGEIADFTCFSFHAVKNFTTAEGGAVTWNPLEGVDDEEIYRNYMLLSLHGQSKDALAKTQLGAWEYDIVLPGYKCNMTDIMAAIGLAQMKRYPALLARRKQIISRYDRAMEQLPVSVLRHYGEDFSSSGHLYLVRLNGKDEQFRNELIIKMAQMDVATNVHFKPLPMHTAYKKLGFSIEDYPNAYAMYRNEVTLPLHTCLSDEQVEYLLECFAKVLKG